MLLANAEEAGALGLTGDPLAPVTDREGRRPIPSWSCTAATCRASRSRSAPVEVVADTTGAGDAFAAGFLTAWSAGTRGRGCGAGRERAGGHRARPSRRRPVNAAMVPGSARSSATRWPPPWPTGRPVVALESTIFSHLGLPGPANAEALTRCLAAVRAAGAVPALTAVLDGVARVGVDPGEHARICGPAARRPNGTWRWPSRRSGRTGPPPSRRRWPWPHAAGIAVFATGGIGGVHRGAESTGDVSADLGAIASHPLVTVCAGAKAFLDLPRTLEELERIGVPVLGWRHDWFPAFYTRSSGLPGAPPRRVGGRGGGGAASTAPVPTSACSWRCPSRPTPSSTRPPWSVTIATALADAAEAEVAGPAVTPYVLERIAAVTAGDSVPANLALAEHNAAVAGAVAVAVSAR